MAGLADVDVATSPVAECGAPPDDADAWHVPHLGRQFVPNSVGKIFLRGVSTDVQERQHRERRDLVGGFGDLALPLDAAQCERHNQRERSPGGGHESQSRRALWCRCMFAADIKRVQEIACRLRAFGRILRQALGDQPRNRERHLGAELDHVLRCLLDVRRDELVRAQAGKGRPSRQHLECDTPERVDVGAMVDIGIADCLLWRHVRGRPDAQPRAGELARLLVAARDAHCLGDTEIRDDGSVA